MTSPQPDPGSFRDREGRVFYSDGEVYRALSEAALADWRDLSQTEFLANALEKGQVVKTSESENVAAPDSGNEALSWAGVLHHERIPFVSYPNEWCFGMLRDAALLHLDLLLAALDEGFVLKDSSAYNIQWRGTEPVFIDLPSFQKLQKGEPWVGYLQFCQQFLYPLLLTAYKNVPFQPYLRASLDGIAPADLNSLFGLGRRFKKGVFTHVYLQSKLADMTASKPKAVRKEARELGFSSELIKSNARGLRKLIANLTWRAPSTEWSDYDTEAKTGHNYSDEEHELKEAFVERAAATSSWPLAWDLGCNTGRFTRIAARHAETTVAMDIDPLAIERFYQALRLEPASSRPNILPLVNDLVDPSPDRGWRGRERGALLERDRPQLILALALVHHLVIGRNVPMAELIEWLATYGAHLVIEFPTREDSMVKRLLLNKDDHYRDYELGFFERCLEQHFEVLEREAQASGERVLYFVRPQS